MHTKGDLTDLSDYLRIRLLSATHKPFKNNHNQDFRHIKSEKKLASEVGPKLWITSREVAK